MMMGCSHRPRRRRTNIHMQPQPQPQPQMHALLPLILLISPLLARSSVAPPPAAPVAPGGHPRPIARAAAWSIPCIPRAAGIGTGCERRVESPARVPRRHGSPLRCFRLSKTSASPSSSSPEEAAAVRRRRTSLGLGRLPPPPTLAHMPRLSMKGDGSGDDDDDANRNDNKAKRKGGFLRNYKFGDISKSVATSITGNEEYKFGDLSRHLDRRAKAAISKITEKDGDYEFGDLSRWLDSKVKDRVGEFTNKTDPYEFGDVTKEIGRRVASGEYTLADLFLLCRTLLSFGVGLTPVAGILPFRLLLQLLNFSIAEEVGGRLAGALALEVDRRMKKAVAGDEDYKLGDLTKRAVLRFAGREDGEEYRFGDVTRAVVARMGDADGGVAATPPAGAGGGVDEPPVSGGDGGTTPLRGEVADGPTDGVVLDARVIEELEQWDAAYRSARSAKGRTDGRGVEG